LLQKLKKKIFISLAVAGLLYLAFTIYADYKQVAAALSSFNWFLFPLLLILTFTNYFSRFVKWDYYLRLINVKIKRIDSFSIFMSGLIMSVTPGKMGELLKSYLVKQLSGAPISKTAPVIFAERITDFISLVIIGLIGAYVYDYGRIVVLAVGVFFLLVIAVISSRGIALSIIKWLERIKYLQKHIILIHNLYESSYILLRPAALLNMTILSFVSWSFECFGYYIILRNFGVEVSFLWASFSYCFAIIIGAVTMLPGGLGVTEGSLTFLLLEKNCPKDIAVASTFIIRIVTLWFAVLIGVISVSLYQKRFGKISEEAIDI